MMGKNLKKIRVCLRLGVEAPSQDAGIRRRAALPNVPQQRHEAVAQLRRVTSCDDILQNTNSTEGLGLQLAAIHTSFVLLG